MLHETSRPWIRLPPHDPPPKLRIGALVPGGTKPLRIGYTGLVAVTSPLCSPADPVTILKVEPGKNVSR